MVNFERSEYVVSEGERVEIRVTVSPKDGNAYECPVGYNFNVSVNTTSAGASELEISIPKHKYRVCVFQHKERISVTSQPPCSFLLAQRVGL